MVHNREEVVGLTNRQEVEEDNPEEAGGLPHQGVLSHRLVEAVDRLHQ